jgi:signal-transduction protein with cAMP-binding, CBS, and nucleotidyltransferase domain
MNQLLFAKGGDVTSRQAVKDFAVEFRQALLDRAAAARAGGGESLFADACASLDAAINMHRNMVGRLAGLNEEISTITAPGLKEETASFYADLYRHFGLFRSAAIFYQSSMAYLQRVSAAIMTQSAAEIGLFARHLPEMALIAVGPAGRCEYSPHCRLQLLLVHAEVPAAQLQTINLFCHSLHNGFEAAGIALDPDVTPRNSAWRGTLAEWQERCTSGLHSQGEEEMINLCRLIDLHPLHPDDGYAMELKRISSATLIGNRSALANLIARMTSLTNGLGIMGGFKLERIGNERGVFRLLDHGLLPLSAALSALALIKKSPATGSCDRVHDLLNRGEFDVDMAERMLASWHSLHGLRLLLELSFGSEEPAGRTLCLNPDALSAEQRHSLKESLESVAIIQRHVDIIFSGMVE